MSRYWPHPIPPGLKRPKPPPPPPRSYKDVGPWKPTQCGYELEKNRNLDGDVPRSGHRFPKPPVGPPNRMVRDDDVSPVKPQPPPPTPLEYHGDPVDPPDYINRGGDLTPLFVGLVLGLLVGMLVASL